MRLRGLTFTALCFGLSAQLAFAEVPYQKDQAMVMAEVNGIELAYTQAGPQDGDPVLLIMGLTASHRLWGEDFVNSLVDAGHRVVLFDNRDTGDSARLNELGEPAIWWQFIKSYLGFDIDAPYTLRDMADDALALLDELDIEQAHIVGASMGGMIAQIIAAENPERTRSLVSIMSTTGAPHLPEPDDQANADLQNLGSSEGDAAKSLRDFGIYPEAMPRQLTAIMHAGDRSAQVESIGVPTLVLHGEEDTLLKPPHGAHTAELIKGSRYVTFSGMGHNMPAEVVPQIIGEMTRHFGTQGIH